MGPNPFPRSHLPCRLPALWLLADMLPRVPTTVDVGIRVKNNFLKLKVTQNLPSTVFIQRALTICEMGEREKGESEERIEG